VKLREALQRCARLDPPVSHGQDLLTLPSVLGGRVSASSGVEAGAQDAGSLPGSGFGAHALPSQPTPGKLRTAVCCQASVCALERVSDRMWVWVRCAYIVCGSHWHAAHRLAKGSAELS
jgi:hypothetical protein